MILKAREYSRGMSTRGMYLYSFKKTVIVLFGKNGKDTSLNGIEEIAKNFKYVKNKINGKKLKQRMRYRFPKHETIDQLQNVFVFDLKTYNDQEVAEAYAAGLYDVNRLRDKWDRDLTLKEIEIEKKILSFLIGLMKTIS